MKKILEFLFGKKEKKNEKEHGNKHDREVCDFGLKKFNTRKRPIEEAPGGVKGKPPKPKPEPPPQPPPTGSGGTIFLDFWGGLVSGTMWNTNGDFTVTDSGLSQIEQDYVVASVKKHFEMLNVTVTDDVNVFNSTPIGRRIRCYITESWEWFGQAGGVAYINSFFWTDNSPCFVFSLLLSYSGHNIAEAASHEPGHTLGLRHQVTCQDGVITSQYNWGDGLRAPTMGASYDVPIGEWWVGPNSLGCNNIQDDLAILKTKLP